MHHVFDCLCQTSPHPFRKSGPVRSIESQHLQIKICRVAVVIGRGLAVYALAGKLPSRAYTARAYTARPRPIRPRWKTAVAFRERERRTKIDARLRPEEVPERAIRR